MDYLPKGFPASGPRRISGASFAQMLRRMSLPARALLGAEILDGNTVVQNHTLQSADLVDVSVSSPLAAARATPAQRVEINAGRRPLQLRQRQLLALPAPAVMSADVTDAEVVNFVRAVGIKRTLDAAVVVEAAQ